MTIMTQDELQSKFTICAITGGLLRPNGQRAGTTRKDGYRIISINHKNYLEHRLIWMYHNGVFPDDMIDHIDRNPSNNRITNLRLATRSENQQNRGQYKNNTSGVLGVSYDKSNNLWFSHITLNKKLKFLGRYRTKEEAIFARKEAELKYHPFKIV